ncbi:unnamed protein product [Agarophyton chilense]
MPKVELHAHLSGSIREKTIRKLLQNPENGAIRREGMALLEVETMTLEHGFRLFPVIHRLICDSEKLHAVVQDVLHDFAEENTVYVELRTTPRDSSNMTCEKYLLTVLRGVAEYHATHQEGLVCRVLVSICRHQPVQMAWDTIELTRRVIEEHPELGDLIVGFDFSGDPKKGSWNEFEPVLRDVRRKFDLPITLHFGEVLNNEECMQMLDFKPDRIGHAAVMSTAVVQRLLSQKRLLGVEVCLTSNLMTTSIADVQDHPVVKYLLPTAHPICICTDDAGIFRTSLSQEYRKLLSVYPMTRAQTTRMLLGALDMAFCRDEKLMNKVRKNACDLLEELESMGANYVGTDE